VVAHRIHVGPGWVGPVCSSVAVDSKHLGTRDRVSEPRWKPKSPVGRGADSARFPSRRSRGCRGYWELQRWEWRDATYSGRYAHHTASSTARCEGSEAAGSLRYRSFMGEPMTQENVKEKSSNPSIDDAFTRRHSCVRMSWHPVNLYLFTCHHHLHLPPPPSCTSPNTTSHSPAHLPILNQNTNC